MTQRSTGSVTYISWSINFALYHCYRLKLFLYIKTWRRPGVFVPLWALALVTLELPTLIAEKIIFDLLGMLDSGERMLLFGQLVTNRTKH